ncbi:hypothetical protein DENSPDRAFT_926437 [Dentipellis sp. KUC8613]|nr:hypothetical protein DENSPDRAFT_926437 [Dentipellis sp. KUC8613]
MSARHAFIPRPASRADRLAEVAAGMEIQRPSTAQQHVKPKPDSHKQPITRGQENPPSIQMQERLKLKDEAEAKDKMSANTNTSSDITRPPLNVTSFKSNRRNTTGAAMQNPNPPPDPSQGRIAAPRARPASPVMPRMPIPRTSWSQMITPDLFEANEAHIPTSASARDRFTPNGLLPDPTPPRRVPLDSIEESMHEDSGYLSAAGVEDESAQRTPARTAAMLRMGRKRPSLVAQEDDGEAEIVEVTGMGHAAKRMRAGGDTYGNNAKSPKFFGGGRSEARVQGQTQGHVQEQPQAPAPQQTSANALGDLFGGLGFDVDDTQLAECADVYERARQRWRDASMDEWRAGADELAQRFGKVLKMVADHVTTKTTAYGALQAKLGAHRAVLEARAETNRKVREALMRNSGNVLGAVQLGEGSGGVPADAAGQ